MLNYSPVHEFAGKADRDALALAQGALLRRPEVGDAFDVAAGILAKGRLLRDVEGLFYTVGDEGPDTYDGSVMREAASGVGYRFDALSDVLEKSIANTERKLKTTLTVERAETEQRYALFAAAGLVVALHQTRWELEDSGFSRGQETVTIRDEREPLRQTAAAFAAGLLVTWRVVDYCKRQGIPLLVTGSTRSGKVSNPTIDMLVGIPQEPGLVVSPTDLGHSWLNLVDVARVRRMGDHTRGADGNTNKPLNVEIITDPRPRQIRTEITPMTGWTPRVGGGSANLFVASDVPVSAEARQQAKPTVCVDTIGNTEVYADLFGERAAEIADELRYRHALNFPSDYSAHVLQRMREM